MTLRIRALYSNQDSSYTAVLSCGHRLKMAGSTIDRDGLHVGANMACYVCSASSLFAADSDKAFGIVTRPQTR